MDENRYTNDYYTNQNQMNQGQVNQNQNSSSGTQGTNYYQTSSTNFQQSQMNHQQAKPVKQKKQSGGFGKKSFSRSVLWTGIWCLCRDRFFGSGYST